MSENLLAHTDILKKFLAAQKKVTMAEQVGKNNPTILFICH